MNWFVEYLSAVWSLFADLWLYMIIGFLVAGIVEEFVPKSWLLKYFGDNNFLSLLRAAGAGFVVSACTCGAIPLVASLRGRGASTATLLTFLLAAPWLGIPMLLVYVAFLGWLNTLFLVILSISIALIAGLIMAQLERKGKIAQGELYANGSFPTGSNPSEDCGCDSNETACCSSNDCCSDETESQDKKKTIAYRSFIQVPKRSWFLGKDIGFYLLLGILLAGIPKAYVQPETINTYLGSSAGVWAVIWALPISIVIEACSEGFAVISGQLYEQGATLAVVFVMTMVGVATDFTELSVVWGKFGRRTTLVYMGIGTTLTIITGILLQIVLTYVKP